MVDRPPAKLPGLTELGLLYRDIGRVEALVEDILLAMADTIKTVPNKISVSGHTDAKPYAGQGDFGNWELSANRANASRRELVTGGLAEGRIVRVVGLADTLPLDPANPTAPLNRRISIIVLNKQAEAALRSGGNKKLDVSSEEGVDVGDIRAGLGASSRPAPRPLPKESAPE